jgi:ankyrin repeat protein
MPTSSLKESDDRTLLSRAAENDHEAVVKLLLDKNADIKSEADIHGLTPLSWTAEKGHEAVVKLLLEKNVDIECNDNIYGQTPLSWAGLPY